MTILRYFVLLALLLLTLPAAAQEEQCIEVWEMWSDDTRHEVNLNTGRVTSYESITPYIAYGVVDSPSGRYSAHIDWETGADELVLTDFDRGVTVVLAENASDPAWSSDGRRLAYIQFDVDRDGQNLVSYDMDTGAYTSAGLTDNEWFALHLDWSPDSSLIAVVGIVDEVDRHSAVRLYSAHDLTLVSTFETTLSEVAMEWSPSGRYLAAYGINTQVALIDVVSDQVYVMTLSEPAFYEFSWSPGESFLLIEHSHSDLNDEIYVVNMQGEFILQEVLVNGYGWANDYQLVVNVWTETGLNDLTLFNLQSGLRLVLQHHSGHFAVSSDGRYVAADTSYLIRFFDLSLERAAPVRVLSVSEPYWQFIWRGDQLELVFLFRDRSLRGYDFASGEWRWIANVPGDERWLRNVPCNH